MLLLLIFSTASGQARGPIAERSALEAYAFRLEDVRLLDGPFKGATQLNAEYLLRLEPDRLLSWFRKEAGLKPKAEVYGGWESRGVAGHSLGHYLSACAMMFASTGDVRFRNRVTYIVAELDDTQRANGNGYLAAIPNGKKIFTEVAAGQIRSQGFDLNGGWVPWYTLHKLFAGLLDAHLYCHNTKALNIAIKLADWADSTLASLTEEQFQRMLACEHGGMNEALAELYARTGNGKYLKLSSRFHHKAVLDPLAQREDRLRGLHANTQIPKLIGLARRYELTGDSQDRTAAEFFWNRVVHHHSYVIGGNSEGEHFGPADKLNDRLSENTTETCNTYNMLKLTRHLFEWRPSAEYADYYERALYNHILASQNPDDGMVCYFVPLKAGSQKKYSTPFDSFWCCVGTGMENHSKYGDAIYFHNNDALWVNLFIASELQWREKNLTLTQQTDFPNSNTTVFTFKTRRPVSVALRLRYPGWATQGITVTVNGNPHAVAGKPASFVEIRRTWKDGDRVQLTLPMSLKLESLPDNPQRAAVLYGPLVLAGELGPEDEAGIPGLILVPALVAENSSYAEWIKPAGTAEPATFRTVNVGKPRDVKLSPFYRLHHRRYVVYWDLFSPERWAVREADYKKELERAHRLEAMTVDFVQPGEMQPERDHNMQGERIETGEHLSRKWRHAVDGGWISFDLKVLPDQPVSLVSTYWGGETGARKFDVLVDGVKIATQSLLNDKPGQFFELRYDIPVALTRDKTKVTVRFQAEPGNIAGGFYGLRVIKGTSL